MKKKISYIIVKTILDDWSLFLRIFKNNSKKKYLNVQLKTKTLIILIETCSTERYIKMLLLFLIIFYCLQSKWHWKGTRKCHFMLSWIRFYFNLYLSFHWIEIDIKIIFWQIPNTVKQLYIVCFISFKKSEK